jgi:hypothetical protein
MVFDQGPLVVFDQGEAVAAGSYGGEAVAAGSYGDLTVAAPLFGGNVFVMVFL